MALLFTVWGEGEVQAPPLCNWCEGARKRCHGVERKKVGVHTVKKHVSESDMDNGAENRSFPTPKTFCSAPPLYIVIWRAFLQCTILEQYYIRLTLVNALAADHFEKKSPLVPVLITRWRLNKNLECPCVSNTWRKTYRLMPLTDNLNSSETIPLSLMVG
jgi:hypothetical protein